MKNHFFLALASLFIVTANASVSISLAEYNFDTNEVVLDISSTEDIWGFQFDILSISDNLSILNVNSDISTGSSQFSYNVGENRVAFATFSALAPGDYSVSIEVEYDEDGAVVYLENYVFSNLSGSIETNIVDPICPDIDLDSYQCSPDNLIGCTDSDACNFHTWAENDDGSCYSEGESVCYAYCASTDCEYQITSDGNATDEYYLQACYPDSICQDNPEFQCCPGSLQNEYICGCEFFGAGLSPYTWSIQQNQGSYFGCMDETACNYDENAQETCNGGGFGEYCSDPGENCCCDYAEENYQCDGSCADGVEVDCLGVCGGGAVIDDCGVCGGNNTSQDCLGVCDGIAIEDACGVCNGTATDQSECSGCMDQSACNYSPIAVEEPEGACSYCYSNNCTDYPQDIYDCSAECLNDFDGDNVCDENEIAGCMDESACNYNQEATNSDQSQCTFAQTNFSCEGECLLCDLGDGLCAECFNDDCSTYPSDTFSCEGECLLCDLGDGQCVECHLNDCIAYPPDVFLCDGSCSNDLDQDGICDENELLGCTDPEACNYSSSATDDDGSCITLVLEGWCDCCGNPDTDDDGVCEQVYCYNNDCSSYPISNFNCLTGECLVEIDECGVCGGDGSVGCENMSNSLVDEIDGIFISSLYPNPFNSTISISLYSQMHSYGNLKIFDLLGNEVYTLYTGQFEKGYSTFYWNASDYNSGLYFVILDSSDNLIRKKILYIK